MLFRELRLSEFLIGLSQLVMTIRIFGCESNRCPQLLHRLRRRSLRKENLAEQVSTVSGVGPCAHQRAEEVERLIEFPFQLEHRGEGLTGAEVVGVRRQFRPECLARLGKLSLLQIDDAEGGVGLGHRRFQLQGTLQRFDRGRVIALVRVRLAEHDLQLRAVAVAGEEAVEDRLGLLGAIAGASAIA